MNSKLSICCAVIGLILVSSCDLTERVPDTILRPTAVLPPQPASANPLGPILENVSQAIQGQEQVYALQEHTSDELMPPVRGTDWYDFGVWTSLDQHTWDASHAQLLNAWNTLNQGITRSNQAIASLSGEQKAQARFLRAWMMWNIADLFGSVPFRPETDIDYLKPPGVKTRTEAIAFVISELQAIDADLKPYATATYGLPSKEAAYFLLARVYLNKFIYDGAATPPATDMDAVVTNVDKITGRSLATGANYFTDNFGINNNSSPEVIWALNNASGNNVGGGAGLGSRYHQSLHYNNNPSGWNGFVTIADFYNKFSANDLRRGSPSNRTAQMAANTGLYLGFNVGQSVDKTGANLKTRGGAPLIFTPDCPLFGASEDKGIRFVKFEPDYTNTQYPANDLPIFRYADAYLMKAEALWRKNGASDVTALTILNDLRNNRIEPDPAPLATIGATTILDERGFELYQEVIRRTDQIRFGTFNGTWNEHPAASAPTRNLFCIPQTAVDSNPALKQNPGY